MTEFSSAQNLATSLLEVESLNVSFRTHKGRVRAVNDLSFSLERGETLGIIGESGSGKSVTALALMRLLHQPPAEINARRISFDGVELLALDESAMEHIRGARIAMVFQDPMTSLNPVLTIGKQIEETLLAHAVCARGATARRAGDLLDMVGIPEARARLSAYPDELSGGMRQRVLLAMALSCSPDLLVADEPTTALDVTVQDQILDLIRQLRRNAGMTIIWISHDLGAVAGLVGRVIIMYAGRIVEDAPVHALYSTPHHPYTRALLHSVPRLDRRRQDRLNMIGGMPPDLVDYPTGCPFHARCPIAVDTCRVNRPELEEVAPGHRVACWRHDQTGER